MPFLAPIFTAISGMVAGVAAWAAASPILAGLAQTAFGLAIKYAIGRLMPQKSQSRAAQLETQYGANIPRSVILGTCATEGHHIYRNNYADGGRLFQDVYVLAHFRITSVPRVRYNGKWRTLTQQDSNGYWLVPNEGTSNDDHDNVRVKFFLGSMDQAAEPTLVNNARPAKRWTNKHRGAGVAYAVVFSELRKQGDGLTSPAKLLFEVKGAPLYDWRKDSSVGGSGPHRWNDQSTWQYSDNPVVELYNLERGFFSGAQRMVGKGVRASRLPLAEWTLAANICDEVMPDGSRRYRAHAIAKDGPGANHDANITPILEAMCGTWVERVDGEFPIAGAPQAIVATLTDDDFKVGAPLRFTKKRKRTELINTVAATYISPDDFYETKDAATRVDSGALAEDRETLASSIPFSAVTDVRQVDRLADIAIRSARYQASAEGTIHPKFLDIVKEGRWVRWNSAKYGDSTFQVLTRQPGGHNSGGVRDIALSFQEISNGVFDPTAYETTPPDIVVIDPPQWLSQVQNFRAVPILVQADGAGNAAGARLVWDAIDDISVLGVDIEYWPANDPTQVFTKFVTADVSVTFISEGLTSLTDWFVRTRLRVSNGRAVAWSAATAFRTLEVSAPINVQVANLGGEVRDLVQNGSQRLDDLSRQVEFLAANVGSANIEDIVDRQAFIKQFGRTKALIVKESGERVSADAALAYDMTLVEARIDDAEGLIAGQALALSETRSEVTDLGGQVSAMSSALTFVSAYAEQGSAQGLMQWKAEAGPTGYAVSYAIQGKVNAAGAWRYGGAFLDVGATGARWRFIADQIVFANQQGDVLALFQPGTNYLNNAFIKELTADNIKAGSIDSPALAFGAVTEQRQLYGDRTFDSNRSWSAITLASATINNQAANLVFVSTNIEMKLARSNSNSQIGGEIKLLRNGEVIESRLIQPSSNQTGTWTIRNSTIDDGDEASVTYSVVIDAFLLIAPGQSASATFKSRCRLVWWKK